jgi:hypothetical protein
MNTSSVHSKATVSGTVTVKFGVIVIVDPNVPEPVPCQEISNWQVENALLMDALAERDRPCPPLVTVPVGLTMVVPVQSPPEIPI